MKPHQLGRALGALGSCLMLAGCTTGAPEVASAPSTTAGRPSPSVVRPTVAADEFSTCLLDERMSGHVALQLAVQNGGTGAVTIESASLVEPQNVELVAAFFGPVADSEAGGEESVTPDPEPEIAEAQEDAKADGLVQLGPAAVLEGGLQRNLRLVVRLRDPDLPGRIDLVTLGVESHGVRSAIQVPGEASIAPKTMSCSDLEEGSFGSPQASSSEVDG